MGVPDAPLDLFGCLPGPALDIESADTLDRIAESLAESGIELRLAEVHEPVRLILERAAATGSRSLPVYATMADAQAEGPGG